MSTFTENEQRLHFTAVREGSGKALSEILETPQPGDIDDTEAFAGLIDDYVDKNPRSFIEGIRAFNNSFYWAHGVPNLRTGVGKVDVFRHSEWSDLFTEPQSHHMLLADRVAMSKAYFREVVRCHYDNPEMWKVLKEAFPAASSIWGIMEQGSLRKADGLVPK